MGRSLRKIFGGRKASKIPPLTSCPKVVAWSDMLSRSQHIIPGPSHYSNSEHDFRFLKPLDISVAIGLKIHDDVCCCGQHQAGS